MWGGSSRQPFHPTHTLGMLPWPMDAACAWSESLGVTSPLMAVLALQIQLPERVGCVLNTSMPWAQQELRSQHQGGSASVPPTQCRVPEEGQANDPCPSSAQGVCAAGVLT